MDIKEMNRFGKKDSGSISDAMGFLYLSAGGGCLKRRHWMHMAPIFAPL